MVNYQNGQIYMIKCNTTNLVYIGSTAQAKLSVRIGEHRRAYKRYLNKTTKICCCSCKILENDNYTYETLEFYKCDCKRQLEERERFYIEDYKNKYGDRVVNKYIPTRSRAEYWDDNKDYFKEKRAIWENNNKDYIITKNHEKYINNRDKCIANAKDYYINHKEEILARQRERYHANKHKNK